MATTTIRFEEMPSVILDGCDAGLLDGECTVEYDREMHVYLVIPPEHIENTDADRFNGDHCAADWKEALWMVEEYAKTLPSIAG